jgi:hypothetical protein
MGDAMAEPDPPGDPAGDPTGEGVDQSSPTKGLTPPTPEEYARWLKEYRMGARSPARLAKLVKASIHRVRHAVRIGWPDKNLPALKDRGEVTDEAVAEAVQKVVNDAEVRAAEVVATIIAGSWEEAARAQLSAAASTTQALTRLAERLSTAAAHASFSTFRRVPDLDPKTGQPRRDEKGNVITILKEHVSAFAVASAAARLATAAKDHAALSKALLSSIAPGGMQQVLTAPPAVVLYMPDNNTGPGSATNGPGGDGDASGS